MLTAILLTPTASPHSVLVALTYSKCLLPSSRTTVFWPGDVSMVMGFVLSASVGVMVSQSPVVLVVAVDAVHDPVGAHGGPAHAAPLFSVVADPATPDRGR